MCIRDSDDLLGVPFLCDVSTALGGLGELDLADRYLRKARDRSDLFAPQVRFASFIQASRRGEVLDVAEQLQRTSPAESWRVRLLSALAHARGGHLATASDLLTDAVRDVVALGFADVRALGERLAFEELQQILADAPTSEPGPQARATEELAGTTPVREPNPRIRVIGCPITLVTEDGRVI